MKSTRAAAHTDGRSFRRALQQELARRCTRNGQYSLRAFARDLETDHSTLSQLLRGRRTLTERTIRKLGAILELPAEKIDAHVLAQLRHPPGEPSAGTVRALRELTEDALAVIAGFEHYAILELTHLTDFRPDVRWIARVLGLSPDVVNVAIFRLVRLGLLRMDSPELWLDCTGDMTNLVDGVAYEAVWGLTQRAHQHAIAAGHTAPDRPSELSSTTLAVDRDKLPEALKILAKARNDVLRVLAQSERPDEVYHLAVSLIPLTENPSEEQAQDNE